LLLTSKSPKEKQPIDRVALVPSFKNSEARATSLTTEEDTNLQEMNTEPRRSPALAATSPVFGETDQNKDETSRLPTDPGKPSVLGALGGKDLLQEMKLKQEKRFSRSPMLSEDKKDATKDTSVQETIKTSEDDQKEQEEEYARENVNKDLCSKKAHTQCKLTSPTVDAKKDLNDNTTDSALLSLPMTVTPSSNLSKASPTHSPRTVLQLRRPVSVVEECGPFEEPPQSMTISTPELMIPDGVGTKSRPLPPVKPRPAILPRPKKRDSDKDCDYEDTLASESALLTKPPLPAAKDAPVTELSCLELRSKPRIQEEGIVTDSATLRLSVKDKIKRISQAQRVSDIQCHIPATVQQKTASLSRDTKLSESMPEDSHINGKTETIKNETLSTEDCSSTLEKTENLILSEKPESSQPEKTDDEIMV
jgi:hypothetical protein